MQRGSFITGWYPSLQYALVSELSRTGCARILKNERAIKTFHFHRTGSRGPEAVTLNSTTVHLKADFSILGIGSLTMATFKNGGRGVGVAVEFVCRERYAQFREKDRVE